MAQWLKTISANNSVTFESNGIYEWLFLRNNSITLETKGCVVNTF